MPHGKMLVLPIVLRLQVVGFKDQSNTFPCFRTCINILEYAGMVELLKRRCQPHQRPSRLFMKGMFCLMHSSMTSCVNLYSRFAVSTFNWATPRQVCDLNGAGCMPFLIRIVFGRGSPVLCWKFRKEEPASRRPPELFVGRTVCLSQPLRLDSPFVHHMSIPSASPPNERNAAATPAACSPAFCKPHQASSSGTKHSSQ